MLEIEIMDRQRVDRIEAEPHQAVFVGSEDPLTGIVKPQIERQAALPALHPG